MLLVAALVAVFSYRTRSADLIWNSAHGHRSAAVTPIGNGRAGFTLVSPAASGLRFTNTLPAQRHYANQILLNGSGVAAGDVDGDGRCDLFFCGLGGRSVLYRNLGDWQFEEAGRNSGLDCTKLDATGAVLVDVEGDRDLDLIVNSAGQGTICFFNDGRGNFDKTPAKTLNQGRCGSSLALGDLDGDGDLDLYVANYRVSTIRDFPHLTFTFKEVNGRPVAVAFGDHALTEPEFANRFQFQFQPGAGGGGSVFHDERGEPDAFYRNMGDGRFEEVSFVGGVFRDSSGAGLKEPPLDWGLSVAIRDLNGDGAPDLYVCNDFSTPDRIWINDGAGHLREPPARALRQTSLSTMAIDVADINRDGLDDIFTADMLSRERWRRLVQKNEPNPNMDLFMDVTTRPQFPRNMLQLNRGDGTYAEIAQLAGVEASEWAWASLFLDVDLDGYEDLLVANGFERDYMNMDANRQINMIVGRARKKLSQKERQGLNRFYPRLATANQAFRNLGDLRFAEVGRTWGFNIPAVSQGMCAADLDNDGDLDIAINNLNDPAALLRNDGPGPRLTVRLRGNPPNTYGIGARIRVTGGAVPSQTQEVISGGRYLSGDEAARMFAAGSLTNRMRVEVLWRGGGRTLLTNALPNHVYEIDEPETPAAGWPPASAPPAPTTLFTDTSQFLNHTYHPVPRDDFNEQPLLPHRLDNLGPGLSWFDSDGDGWDDLLVPGGTGSPVVAFRNNGSGKFDKTLFSDAGDRADASVLGLAVLENRLTVVATAGTGSGEEESSRVEVSAAAPEGFGTLPFDAKVNPGPLAAADLDGDGDLDLFVGGRFIRTRWPEPAPSRLYRRSAGKWEPDAGNDLRLDKAGLINGAVFTDLDGDGDPDLVLANDWGPLRIFRNTNGALAPWDWPLSGCCGDSSTETTLLQLSGRWNGVASGDFDGDGRLDLVVSNWGRNTSAESFRSRPIRLYYGDFNGDPNLEVLQGWFDEDLKDYGANLNIWTLSRALPWLLAKFNTYQAFGRSSIREALQGQVSSVRQLEAERLESTLFLNRGDHFEIRALPVEAQMAPGFGICVADFNGDGAEDLFLGQNFFGVRREDSRHDAGRGLLLEGDGTGNFAVTPDSGLEIYGEQRGAAVADYDQDGRVDLAVAQVDGSIRLLRNARGKPGLRVKLRGPAANPNGIGSLIRVRSGGRLGPAREIQAGSGYWSQNSSLQVMAVTPDSTHLWVRWPNGHTEEFAIPVGAREISPKAAP